MFRHGNITLYLSKETSVYNILKNFRINWNYLVVTTFNYFGFQLTILLLRHILTNSPEIQRIGIISKYSLARLSVSYSCLVPFVIVMKYDTWSTYKVVSVLLIQILIPFEQLKLTILLFCIPEIFQSETRNRNTILVNIKIQRLKEVPKLLCCFYTWLYV